MNQKASSPGLILRKWEGKSLGTRSWCTCRSCADRGVFELLLRSPSCQQVSVKCWLRVAVDFSLNKYGFLFHVLVRVKQRAPTTTPSRRSTDARCRPPLECKTVGFFLKISKEIGKAWRKSPARANRASLTRPSLFSALFHTFCLTAGAYLNTHKYGLFCSLVRPLPSSVMENNEHLNESICSLYYWMF